MRLTVTIGITTPKTTSIQSLIVDFWWGYLIDSSLQKNPRSCGLRIYFTVNAGTRTKWRKKVNKSKQISVKLSCASFNRSEPAKREMCETWSCEVLCCSWTWTSQIRLILRRKNVTNIKRDHKLPAFTSVVVGSPLVQTHKGKVILLLCAYKTQSECRKEQICIFGCCKISWNWWIMLSEVE